MAENDTPSPAPSDETRTGLGGLAERAPLAERSTTIGPYRLVRPLGEGGMGEVWEAKQKEPIERTVALKLVKLGMDTNQFIARFESERQALALMEHPCVARVIDGGATETGRPYFVMEYVEGRPITEYCDEHRLTIRQRLELLVALCGGVQHAHQRGIIHRDLKPSNVLVAEVDGKPTPKIIDFGVAKATSQSLTDKTVHTVLGGWLGTPAYMAPEQAEITDDIDTRADVYSLGVMLYELLTGLRPFDMETLVSAGFDEMRRVIREVDPPRPSTRASEASPTAAAIAQSRQIEPRVLARVLVGDLDWIVMRAVEKEKERRYGSATELAADIQRHLRNEPVLARPPSRAYRTRKFVRRHRLGVVAAVLVTVAVLAGAGVSLWQAVLARAAERTAIEEAESARRVADFLVGLFEESDPFKNPGETTVREVLDKGAQRVRVELEGSPLVQARLMATIGDVYDSLGFAERGLPLHLSALSIRRELLGEDPLTAASMFNVASARSRDEGVAEAEKLFREGIGLLERTQEMGSADLAVGYNNLGLLLADQGRTEEALSLIRQALDMNRRLLGESTAVSSNLGNLASLLAETGRLAEVESVRREVVEIDRRSNPDNPTTATSIANLANVLLLVGKLEEAEELHREALGLRREFLGEGEHWEETLSLLGLARVLALQGEYGEAEALLDECIRLRRELLGADHRRTIIALRHRAELERLRGDSASAEKAYREALNLARRKLRPGSDELGESLLGVALSLLEQGKTEEASGYAREAVALYRANHPEDNWRVAAAESVLGAQLTASGDPAGGRSLLERSCAILAVELTQQAPLTQRCEKWLDQ